MLKILLHAFLLTACIVQFSCSSKPNILFTERLFEILFTPLHVQAPKPPPTSPLAVLYDLPKSSIRLGVPLANPTNKICTSLKTYDRNEISYSTIVNTLGLLRSSSSGSVVGFWDPLSECYVSSDRGSCGEFEITKYISDCSGDVRRIVDTSSEAFIHFKRIMAWRKSAHTIDSIHRDVVELVQTREWLAEHIRKGSHTGLRRPFASESREERSKLQQLVRELGRGFISIDEASPLTGDDRHIESLNDQGHEDGTTPIISTSGVVLEDIIRKRESIDSLIQQRFSDMIHQCRYLLTETVLNDQQFKALEQQLDTHFQNFSSAARNAVSSVLQTVALEYGLISSQNASTSEWSSMIHLSEMISDFHTALRTIATEIRTGTAIRPTSNAVASFYRLWFAALKSAVVRWIITDTALQIQVSESVEFPTGELLSIVEVLNTTLLESVNIVPIYSTMDEKLRLSHADFILELSERTHKELLHIDSRHGIDLLALTTKAEHLRSMERIFSQLVADIDFDSVSLFQPSAVSGVVAMNGSCYLGASGDLSTLAFNIPGFQFMPVLQQALDIPTHAHVSLLTGSSTSRTALDLATVIRVQQMHINTPAKQPQRSQRRIRTIQTRTIQALPRTTRSSASTGTCSPGLCLPNCRPCPVGSWSSGDGIQRLCNNAPETGSIYFMSGWYSTDCPFMCTDSEFYAHQNECRKVPDGFYLVPGMFPTQLQPCSYPSPAHQQLSTFSSHSINGQFGCQMRFRRVLTASVPSSDTDLSESFTIQLWVNFEEQLLTTMLEDTSTERGVVFGLVAVEHMFDWALRVRKADSSIIGTFEFALKDVSSPAISSNMEINIQANQWIHLAVIGDKNSMLMKFIVNSIEIDSQWFAAFDSLLSPSESSALLIIGGTHRDITLQSSSMNGTITTTIHHRNLPAKISRFQFHRTALPPHMLSYPPEAVSTVCEASEWFINGCMSTVCSVPGMERAVMSSITLSPSAEMNQTAAHLIRGPMCGCTCQSGRYFDNDSKRCKFCPADSTGTLYPAYSLSSCMCGDGYLRVNNSQLCVLGKPAFETPSISPNITSTAVYSTGTVITLYPPAEALNNNGYNSVMRVQLYRSAVLSLDREYTYNEFPVQVSLNVSGSFTLKAQVNEEGRLMGNQLSVVVNVKRQAQPPTANPPAGLLSAPAYLALTSRDAPTVTATSSTETPSCQIQFMITNRLGQSVQQDMVEYIPAFAPVVYPGDQVQTQTVCSDTATDIMSSGMLVYQYLETSSSTIVPNATVDNVTRSDPIEDLIQQSIQLCLANEMICYPTIAAAIATLSAPGLLLLVLFLRVRRKRVRALDKLSRNAPKALSLNDLQPPSAEVSVMIQHKLKTSPERRRQAVGVTVSDTVKKTAKHQKKKKRKQRKRKAKRSKSEAEQRTDPSQSTETVDVAGALKPKDKHKGKAIMPEETTSNDRQKPSEEQKPKAQKSSKKRKPRKEARTHKHLQKERPCSVDLLSLMKQQQKSDKKKKRKTKNKTQKKEEASATAPAESEITELQQTPPKVCETAKIDNAKRASMTNPIELNDLDLSSILPAVSEADIVNANVKSDPEHLDNVNSAEKLYDGASDNDDNESPARSTTNANVDNEQQSVNEQKEKPNQQQSSPQQQLPVDNWAPYQRPMQTPERVPPPMPYYNPYDMMMMYPMGPIGYPSNLMMPSTSSQPMPPFEHNYYADTPNRKPKHRRRKRRDNWSSGDEYYLDDHNSQHRDENDEDSASDSPTVPRKRRETQSKPEQNGSEPRRKQRNQKSCIYCARCDQSPATTHCTDCKLYCCKGCNILLHVKKANKDHYRSRMMICDVCFTHSSPLVYHPGNNELYLCSECHRSAQLELPTATVMLDRDEYFEDNGFGEDECMYVYGCEVCNQEEATFLCQLTVDEEVKACKSCADMYSKAF